MTKQFREALEGGHDPLHKQAAHDGRDDLGAVGPRPLGAPLASRPSAFFLRSDPLNPHRLMLLQFPWRRNLAALHGGEAFFDAFEVGFEVDVVVAAERGGEFLAGQEPEGGAVAAGDDADVAAADFFEGARERIAAVVGGAAGADRLAGQTRTASEEHREELAGAG